MESNTTPLSRDARTPLAANGSWIEHFDPEDQHFWQTHGQRIAKRNLWLSIFAEFLGFAVWQLWAVTAPMLTRVGYSLTPDQIFWLIAVPNLVGATLRFPYTFAVPRFGGRNWTVISSLLLILPCIGLVYVVLNPGTSFTVMLLLAALGGVGGGNFASSMANISFFYPEAEKGRALGLNAAGGNLGVAVALLVIPLVVVSGSGIALERAGLLWIPLALLSALLAWRYMSNLSTAKTDFSGYAGAFRHRHTWIMSVLYIGTFGSFIGFSGAFPTLISIAFPDVSLGLAFMGALVGSLARPLGGSLADRFGGARMTVVSFVMMIIGALGVIHALEIGSFLLFFTTFMLLFVFTGVGNGATYRMIPAIFRAGVETRDYAAMNVVKRHAAAAIGVIAAIGAYGGFLVPRGFALSSSLSGSLVMALYAFIGFYLLCIAIVWGCYMRRGNRFERLGVHV